MHVCKNARLLLHYTHYIYIYIWTFTIAQAKIRSQVLKMFTTLANFNPALVVSNFSLFASDSRTIESKLDIVVDNMFLQPGPVVVGDITDEFPRFTSAIFSSFYPTMSPAVRRSAFTCLRSFVQGAGIRYVMYMRSHA